MLTLLQKEMSKVSQIWKNTNFSFQHLPRSVRVLRKDFQTFLKHTCSLKGKVENLEGNLVSTANTHSENTERRLQLNLHSSMSEHIKFNNEGKTHNILNLRDP